MDDSEDKRGKHPNSLANLVLYKPGQSGNPNGKDSLRPLRSMTKKEIIEVGTYLLDNNITAIREIVKDGINNPDSKHSALKVWMSQIVLQNSKKGNVQAFDLLMNRIVGKVSDRIDLNVENNKPIKGDLTPEQKIEAVRQMKDVLQLIDDGANVTIIED